MENEKSTDGISEASVQGLAAIGASDKEICDYLGIGRDELNERFDALIRRHRAMFQLRLRQMQFNIAVNNQGNPRMLQWLGKFNLSQNERENEQEIRVPVKGYVGIDPDQV